MFSDIRQGFLNEPVNDGLHRQGEKPVEVDQVHLPLGPGDRAGEVVDQGTQGLGQPQVLHVPRAQVMIEAPDFLDHLIDVVQLGPKLLLQVLLLRR